MNNEPKFCLNCRWHLSQATDHGTGHVCTHPDSEADKQGPEFDLVTGEESGIFDRYRACGTMREFDMCGPDAKLWEEKV